MHLFARGLFAAGLAIAITGPVFGQKGSERPVMSATKDFVFVLRGGVLYKFDILNLKLLHRVSLDAVDAKAWRAEQQALQRGKKRGVPTPPEVDVPVLREVASDAPETIRNSGRARLAAGGGKALAGGIEAALGWLERHQDEDGRWDADGFMKHDTRGTRTTGLGNPIHDVGATGLALLAFMADGSTMRSGPFKEQVKRGVAWLKDQQDASGRFGTNATHDFIYDHAIATLAMCEAYGLSNYKLLEKVAQGGIDYLEKHRNPYAVWRYQPRDNDNDTSVTGWAVMAYCAARDFGLRVNKSALKMCAVWYDAVTDPATGRHGYTKRGEASSRSIGDHATKFPVSRGEALTSAGLFCRFLLGQQPETHPIMVKAADTVLMRPPEWKAGSVDEYYWFFGSYAMFQMGGRHWNSWSKFMIPAIAKNQRTDGNFAGSWDPIGVWGKDGGRIYTTALMTLSLQVFYRYTRLTGGK